MHTLKKSILLSLESSDLAALVALAKDKPRIVSLLVRISYDKETLDGPSSSCLRVEILS